MVFTVEKSMFTLLFSTHLSELCHLHVKTKKNGRQHFAEFASLKRSIGVTALIH